MSKNEWPLVICVIFAVALAVFLPRGLGERRKEQFKQPATAQCICASPEQIKELQMQFNKLSALFIDVRDTCLLLKVEQVLEIKNNQKR